MTRFWWVRHGPTHARAMVGWTDLPADLGDTAALARLSDFLPPDAPVVASDLCRAVETANAIAAGRPRLPDLAGLREINFGAWEMRSFADIEAEDPTRILAFYDHPGQVRPPGGESWGETCARVNSAVAALLDTNPGPEIIVVAHFGAILTQVQRALNIPPRDAFAHRIDNLSVTEIRFDKTWSAGRINHHPQSPAT